MAWSAYGLRRAWNVAKDQRAPWWPENSKEAYSSGLANLATALSNWSASRSGRRAGPTVAFPRFKSRRSRLSCRFTTGAYGLGTDRQHVRLPRLGWVRTHESTRKLARRIETGIARIRSATVSFQRGRWHVSFSVELPDPMLAQRTSDRVIGVDLGVKSLAVLSSGEVVPNPRHLDGALAALRRAQRRCSGDMAPTGVPERHRRTGGAKPMTGSLRFTPGLVTSAATGCISSLPDWSPSTTRSWSKTCTWLGWSAIATWPARSPGWVWLSCAAKSSTKAADAGVRVVVADRWYPSSKTCSACGAVKAKLTLAERQFTCESCGTRLDRDHNAARNLAALASQVVHGQLDRDVKQPAGNPRKTATGGNGYRHGKTQTMSQRRPREVATP